MLSDCESIFALDLHIDQIFFQDPTTTALALPPGRMSPISAANFIFLGGALMLLAGRGRPQFVQLLACSSGFLSLVVLTGTSYGLAALAGNLHYTAVALHTNFCFMLLFTGILCATGEHGMMRLLTDSGTSGKVLRRLLPTAILVPLVVSSITATLERLGFLSFEIGISIFSISTIVAFTSLVWRSGAFLHRSENITRQTESRLRESLSRYNLPRRRHARDGLDRQGRRQRRLFQPALARVHRAQPRRIAQLGLEDHPAPRRPAALRRSLERVAQDRPHL